MGGPSLRDEAERFASERTDEERRIIELNKRRDRHPGKATDAAWELAEEYGLCPSLIDGSGQNGRVLKGDVEDALDDLRQKLS